MSEANKAISAAPGPTVLSSEEKKQRGQRNLAIALSLGAFIILIFAVTILRLGGAGAG